ncbi:SDR family NAD(P)-dependent oxidoreductase [uncultured Roseobacter sp.]|uniref:SDR family NAD(P)-dependent oxidoreductase n=1 Tax=uncultured Roseobacter sp. TaxID=114847 RepID=UPI002624DC99|nr:SDR family oxidoreductase [uncultured Roseobacter sp.]
MDLGIAGRRALITGATGGLGRATAKLLAEEGVSLILSDVDGDALEELAKTYDAVVCAADLSKEDGVTALKHTAEVEGGTDIVLHLAGITGAKGDPLKMTDEDFNVCWQTNFMSAVRLSRAFVPDMVSNGWGRLVFTTSENAVQPYVDETVYNTSKAALLSFLKSLSLAYGPTGVRVNAIAPAFIETPMTDKMMQDRADERDETFEDAVESFLEVERPYLTLKRRGKPEEVAAVAAFLASNHASFVNGAAYRVDGGAVAAINT